MDKQAATKSVLKNVKKIIKLIPDRKNPHYELIDPKHDGVHLFTDCTRQYQLPLSTKHGGLNRILNPEQQEAFEVLLDKKPGDLSFFKQENNFWSTFIVKLEKEGIVLDLNDPLQNLQFRVLEVIPEVAPNFESRHDKGEYKFYMEEDGFVVKSESEKVINKMTAYTKLEELKKIPAKLRAVLVSLGVKVERNADVDFMVIELSKIIENNDKYSGGKKVSDFFDVLKDTSIITKVFISDLVSIGALKQSSSGIYLKDGDKIANTLSETVKWLEEPANSEMKKILENKLKG